MSKISGYNDGRETADKDIAFAGGPHIMSVADIRNLLVSMGAHLNTLNEVLDNNDIYDVHTTYALNQLRADFEKLGQYDNNK